LKIEQGMGMSCELGIDEDFNPRIFPFACYLYKIYLYFLFQITVLPLILYDLVVNWFLSYLLIVYLQFIF
jgi:hypothetical protein